MRSILLLLLSFSFSGSEQPKFGLRELSKLVNVADPQISPDGKSIVIVVSRPDYEVDLYRSELVLVDVGSHRERVLTHERKGVRYPRWSPEGDRLAFLANDLSDKPQIFVMSMSGGDPEQLTKAITGVQHYRWRPDGEAIVYSASDQAPKKTDPEKFEDGFEVGNNSFLATAQPLPTHLWLIASSGGEAKRLTSGSWSVQAAKIPRAQNVPFTWAPDGKSIVFVKLPTPYSGDGNNSTLESLDVTSGQLQPVTGRRKYEQNPDLSRDGRRLAYLFPHEGKIQNGGDAYVVSGNHGKGKSVSGQIDRDIVRLEWMPDNNSLLIGGNDHTTVGLWIQPLEGKPVRLDLGSVCPSAPGWWVDLSVGSRGDVAFAGSEPKHPMELYYLSNANAKPSRLTDFNSHVASLDLARAETIEWTSTDGYKEDGLLTYPPDFSSNRRYPLVVNIHGGPTAASHETFSVLPQLMAAQGWIVFEPNYRGSDNLGNRYQSAIFGDAGDGPARDVMAGLKKVEKRGFVDETNIAVTGWSYGGTMTTWLLGHYGGWKAAIAGAPLTDWLDEYNLSDFNVRMIDGFSPPAIGSPYVGNTMKAYIEQSSITYANKISTPTLIFSDTGDDLVPVTQSYRLYHALKDHGVPTRFVAYPIPGHSPADPVRQRDLFRRWIDWLSRYLNSDGARSSR